MSYANIAACAVPIPIYLLMLYSLVVSRKYWERYSRTFLLILIFAVIQTAVELISSVPDFLDGLWAHRYVRIILNLSSYAMASAYALFLYELTCYRVGEENTRGKKWAYVTLALWDIQLVVLLVMTLNGTLYGDDPNVQGVPMAVRLMVTMGYPMLVLLGNIVMILLNPLTRKQKTSITLFCLILFLMIPLNIFASDVVRAPIFLFQIVDLYCNIYIAQVQASSEQRLQLENTRSKLLYSQIEPHFIYNALTGVITLCDVDPEEAKKTLYDFSHYLRVHLDSMKLEGPVSLNQELEHAKVYLEIEKKRFGDTIQLEYDIKAEDIFLPPLTIQPLIENAVKHGITVRSGGGTIRVSSWEDAKNDYVRIEDDGVGFDTGTLKENEFTGIRNIELRLKYMVHGSLKITSREGEGTSVVIQVPREV